MGRTDRVDERVALAPPLVEERERGLDLAGVEEVALQAERLFGARGDEGFLRVAQLGLVASEDGDAGPLRGEQLRARTADAARPPATTVARPLSPSCTVSLPSAGELAGEVPGSEGFAGRVLDEPVPALREAPGAKNSSTRKRPAVGLVDEPTEARVEGGVELRRDELPVEIVLVVDGHDGEVDLGGPVGRVTALGRACTSW